MNTTELFFNFITSKLKIGRKISLLKSCHQVHCTTSLVPTNFGEKHKLSLSPCEKYVRRFSHLYCKIYQKKKYEHISLVSSVENWRDCQCHLWAPPGNTSSTGSSHQLRNTPTESHYPWRSCSKILSWISYFSYEWLRQRALWLSSGSFHFFWKDLWRINPTDHRHAVRPVSNPFYFFGEVSDLYKRTYIYMWSSMNSIEVYNERNWTLELQLNTIWKLFQSTSHLRSGTETHQGKNILINDRIYYLRILKVKLL